MVRVGGGWVALDEFLVKNDPCRGKFATYIIQLTLKYSTWDVTGVPWRGIEKSSLDLTWFNLVFVVIVEEFSVVRLNEQFVFSKLI